MVSIVFVFWLFIFLFGLVGAVRGWAKELVVVFSVILALFLINVMENFVPWVRDVLPTLPAEARFWVRGGLVAVLAFFGYQTPTAFARIGAKSQRVGERVQDWLLGLILGSVNGYLVVGSIWHYLIASGYPFQVIRQPTPGDPYFDLATQLVGILAPVWLVSPTIYFAVGIAFVFVIVVFL